MGWMGEKLAALLESRVIKFINAVTNTNTDMPYHDYYTVEDGSEPAQYDVGHNQVTGHGDQRKLFASKNTLIMATAAATIRFNSGNNVLITLLANTWYTFYSNIHTLFIVAIAQGGTLYAYFEGTLPEEARSPE